MLAPAARRPGSRVAETALPHSSSESRSLAGIPALEAATVQSRGVTAETPVVIVGAGPAGLAAALELARAGVPVVVVESDSRVGGLAQTVEYKGFRFDIGGHRFFTNIPAVRD